MAKTKKLTGRKRDERITAYMFVAPAVILLIAFLVVPMIYTVYFSGFKYQIMRPDAIKFIGLENYQKLFSDKNFWIALKNTVYFTVLVVPIQCALALGLALLVSKKFRGVSIFRTMYFSPQLTSMVVIAVLWSVIYNANPNTGLINSLLVSLGMEPIKFLSDADTAMNSIIFMSAWQGAGYQMMIFLAGLQGINGELYEACSLDGANAWQRFRYITWPQLQPTTFFVTIILTINCFKVYDIVYMLAGGNAGVLNESAIVLVYHIYEEAVRNWNLGYASAVAMVLFLIVLAITLVQFRGEKKYSN